MMRAETERKRESTYVCHNRNKKERKAFPMVAHVSLWEFYADGKDANREDNPGQFEGNVCFCLVVPPRSWVEYSGSIRT